MKAELEVAEGHANVTKELLHRRCGHPGQKAQRKLNKDATGEAPDGCVAGAPRRAGSRPFRSSWVLVLRTGGPRS